MGKLFEQEAHEHRHHLQRQDSLEEKVTLFLDSESLEAAAHLCAEEFRDQESVGSLDSVDPAQRSLYWESRQGLLQEMLERYQSTASKLREEVIQSVKEARKVSSCWCQNTSSDGCMSCVRRQLVHFLRQKGLTSTLRISQWKPTKKHPAGRHEYTELVVSTRERRREVRLVIEMEFREQFKIAKACEEYVRLVNQLPEIYVGKADQLQGIARVVSKAAARSMKEKNIHVGPWRKSSFVQMKWSNARSVVEEECLRVCAAPAVVVTHGFASGIKEV